MKKNEVKEIMEFINSNLKFSDDFAIKDEKQFGNFYRVARMCCIKSDGKDGKSLIKLNDLLADKVDAYRNYGFAVIKSNDNALKLYLTDIDRLNKIKTLRSRTEDKCNRRGSLLIYFDEDTNKIILKCKNCNTIIDYVE